MYDVLIIGAGITGAFIARELSRYNLKIAIAEKASDVAMGATKANSAIVHAGYDAKPGTLKARFNVEGSKMYEQICRELGAKYKRIGALVVGFNEEDLKTIEELYQRGIKNGVEGLEVLRTREAVLSRDPFVGESVCCALYAPTSAITCPYELCIAAVGNAMDNGAELLLNTNGLDLVKDAKVVINAAGVYADEVASALGDESFKITPRRGEYVLLDKTEKEAGLIKLCEDPAWDAQADDLPGNLSLGASKSDAKPTTVTHTIFRCPSNMGKGILVSPTVDGNMLLGPTADNREDKQDTATTAVGLASVKAAALQQAKGINLGTGITAFSGLRAVGSTGDFIIGPAHDKNGEVIPHVYNAAGIESPGLTSAPAIGKYLAETVVEDLRGEGINVKENKNFNPIRKPSHFFKELNIEEKDAYIKEHPEYGHIICRCETVSEGEILDAIRTNPKPTDLDGVKRRTRAQMGRCQGGFCSPVVASILAKELGVPLDSITKKGPGSEILQ